jgi:diguanylate cyclase
VDVLKIDRQFITDMANDSGDILIVETIVAMAASLGLTVVAEGVETVAQLRRLETCGCGRGQGYLWSRPLAPDRLALLVEETAGDLRPRVAR